MQKEWRKEWKNFNAPITQVQNGLANGQPCFLFTLTSCFAVLAAHMSALDACDGDPRHEVKSECLSCQCSFFCGLAVPNSRLHALDFENHSGLMRDPQSSDPASRRPPLLPVLLFSEDPAPLANYGDRATALGWAWGGTRLTTVCMRAQEGCSAWPDAVAPPGLPPNNLPAPVALSLTQSLRSILTWILGLLPFASFFLLLSLRPWGLSLRSVQQGESLRNKSVSVINLVIIIINLILVEFTTCQALFRVFYVYSFVKNIL